MTMNRVGIPATPPDPRVSVVADAMREYDRSRQDGEKTWRELAIVAIASLDQWHIIHDPRYIQLSPGEQYRILQSLMASEPTADSLFPH